MRAGVSVVAFLVLAALSFALSTLGIEAVRHVAAPTAAACAERAP